MPRFSIGLVLLSAALLAGSNTAPTNYTESIHAWQKTRNERLRHPDSWLTLVGLFWLTPSGVSSIGSADSNDFVLPKRKSPAQLGKLRQKGDTVFFTNLGGSTVTVNHRPVTSEVALNYKGNEPDTVYAGSISFFVIERSGKLGIRAKDSESPVLKNFQGLQYFPVHPDLHFEAKLIPDPKKIPILNILGQTDWEESPGVVEFTYQGKSYHLRPIYEDQTLFFLFKDLTNKTQTYQAGRFLNTPLPVNGKVDLDFNKSYNPPCTFTPYATCPLPPKENALPIPIEAGELRYGKGHVE